MKLKHILNELFTSAHMNLNWADTPMGVRDSHTGDPTLLPIHVPDDCREDKKKKKKVRKKKLKENKTSERQTQFAEENFQGVGEIGREILELSDEIKDIEKKLVLIKRSKEENRFKELLKQIKNNEDQISILWTALFIKLTSVVGHAVNGNKTGPLKKIINFMDKIGINDSIFKHTVDKIANTRIIVGGGFLDICAVVAARHNDLQFIKQLEKFAEKNKSRTTSIESKRYESDMRSLTMISQTDRIALEALVSGSEEVYKYITKGKGIDKKYVMQFIEKDSSGWYIKRLVQGEIVNVILLEPTLAKEIQTEMPENVTGGVQDAIDIFVFF